ncbi:MAG: DUF2334 domain-containing protein [Verrucomicrobia bacterium]|nr:DUF2334 domain-containing protein [Verrucomicrobiota bacterium]
MKNTRYVILRDDDTNAFTPVECLERLYRPFRDRGLPVNLAVIPEVRADATRYNGEPEGFLFAKNGASAAATAPIGRNRELVSYLRANPAFHVAQHGCHHDLDEFARTDRAEIVRRLKHGARSFAEAGFPAPETFVAPYDRFSRASLGEVARRFRVVSAGWYELRRLPPAWWPGYFFKKARRHPHWRVKGAILLSHPGCLLSGARPPDTMLAAVRHAVASRRLTVLVTHWWEYFPGGAPDEAFIHVLHQVADFLASEREVRALSFAELLAEDIPLR